MKDCELLTFAAKAVGIKAPTNEDPHFYLDDRGIHRDISCENDGTLMSHWNPLIDDGDALRLAVQLGLVVDCEGVSNRGLMFEAGILVDSYTATRRAITIAAAEIGKRMK